MSENFRRIFCLTLYVLLSRLHVQQSMWGHRFMCHVTTLMTSHSAEVAGFRYGSRQFSLLVPLYELANSKVRL